MVVALAGAAVSLDALGVDLTRRDAGPDSRPSGGRGTRQSTTPTQVYCVGRNYRETRLEMINGAQASAARGHYRF